MFKRIFYGVSLDSPVYAMKIDVVINPYTPGQDQLSMLRNDINHNLFATFLQEEGILRIVKQDSETVLTAEDWNHVLNYATYRLNIDVSIYDICYYKCIMYS